jgi:KDO2-lipid IV(A) lauroyltransferase
LIKLLLKAISRFFYRLSDRNLERLSFALAFILYRVLAFRRKMLRRNIRTALGENLSDKEVDRIALSSVQSLMLTAMEFMEAEYRDIASTLTLHDSHIVQDALSEGRGCYIMVVHMGNWEALAAAVCRTICPSYVPVKEVGGESVNSYVMGIRKKYGLMTIKRRRKGDSYRVIVETLKEGRIVGFMQDQARPGAPRLDFFGKSAKTNTSMPAIWAKHPAPIIPLVTRRIAVRKHEGRFLEPLKMTTTGDFDADVITNSNMMNRVVEKMILTNPTQYLWLHDRWK